LDFAKAFDTVEHVVILKVFECLSFDQRWLTWLKMLMSMETSAILLNGIPEKKPAAVVSGKVTLSCLFYLWASLISYKQWLISYFGLGICMLL
jgi:hypothetical protein